MHDAPLELTLELAPRSRFDLIDLSSSILDRDGDFFRRFRRAVYCSHHTTAGFFEQSLCARLGHRREALTTFLRIFSRLFPPGAPYQHDNLPLRSELTDEQKASEPKNADSHLAFIGAGLRSCVTYRNEPETPVFLVDLDGVNGDFRRQRRATVLGYREEREVASLELDVPVSHQSIDAVSLRDSGHGLWTRLEETVRGADIDRGRIDIVLAPDEKRAGLTVNEYETLLMRHDLSEVLQDPLRFVAEKGRHILSDPLSVPNKTLNYATYDFVHLVRDAMSALNLGASSLERLAARLTGGAASRFLRLRRQISLLVAGGGEDGPRIVRGRYQSPILVQWGPAQASHRRLVARVIAFE